MNTFQKVIKYAAITFAVILAVGIVSGIVGLARFAVSLFDERKDYKNYKGENTMNFFEEFDNVDKLDIENGVGKLIVKSGDGKTVKVEGYNVSSSFKATVRNNTLYIKEEGLAKKFLGLEFGTYDKDSSITVYLPDNLPRGKFILKAVPER